MKSTRVRHENVNLELIVFSIPPDTIRASFLSMFSGNVIETISLSGILHFRFDSIMPINVTGCPVFVGEVEVNEYSGVEIERILSGVTHGFNRGRTTSIDSLFRLRAEGGELSIDVCALGFEGKIPLSPP